MAAPTFIASYKSANVHCHLHISPDMYCSIHICPNLHRPYCLQKCNVSSFQVKKWHRKKVFPTRLLTSEDEYRWYWHQMIYFPETINTISTLNTISTTLSLVSSKSLCTLLTLCMLASRSRGEIFFLSLLSSSHSVTSRHVLPLPLSGLNWPSLFLPRGFWPLSPKMASLFTGSAHPPLPGSGTKGSSIFK